MPFMNLVRTTQSCSQWVRARLKFTFIYLFIFHFSILRANAAVLSANKTKGLLLAWLLRSGAAVLPHRAEIVPGSERKTLFEPQLPKLTRVHVRVCVCHISTYTCHTHTLVWRRLSARLCRADACAQRSSAALQREFLQKWFALSAELLAF